MNHLSIVEIPAVFFNHRGHRGWAEGTKILTPALSKGEGVLFLSIDVMEMICPSAVWIPTEWQEGVLSPREEVELRSVRRKRDVPGSQISLFGRG